MQASKTAAAPAGSGEEDHFDGLPDSIVLDIFNRIGDVKALGRCSLVSRRFHALVPLVDSVVVRVDCVISDDPYAVPAAEASGTRGVFSVLARLVLGGIFKPIQAIGQILPNRRHSTAASSAGDTLHHSPSDVLKGFKALRHLRIELPAGELGVEDGAVLKWKADFGCTLGNCVIFGAASASMENPNPNNSSDSTLSTEPDEDVGRIPESFYTNGGLKLRVVWTISSLIAASARHYLLQPIVAEHGTLHSLTLTDADGQGVLAMGRRQLEELMAKPVPLSGTARRTLMPALKMQLWYSLRVELPSGLVLEGATLAAIRPVNSTSGDGDGLSWVADAFDEPNCSAVRMLMKRRTYSLEMNSF